MKKYAIGIDLGGTKILAGVVDLIFRIPTMMHLH